MKNNKFEIREVSTVGLDMPFFRDKVKECEVTVCNNLFNNTITKSTLYYDEHGYVCKEVDAITGEVLYEYNEDDEVNNKMLKTLFYDNEPMAVIAPVEECDYYVNGDLLYEGKKDPDSAVYTIEIETDEYHNIKEMVVFMDNERISTESYEYILK